MVPFSVLLFPMQSTEIQPKESGAGADVSFVKIMGSLFFSTGKEGDVSQSLKYRVGRIGTKIIK